ncbi:MAG: hypothetical protein AB1705_18400 [Verrucomicrobiota bacterium]
MSIGTRALTVVVVLAGGLALAWVGSAQSTKVIIPQAAGGNGNGGGQGNGNDGDNGGGNGKAKGKNKPTIAERPTIIPRSPTESAGSDKGKGKPDKPGRPDNPEMSTEVKALVERAQAAREEYLRRQKELHALLGEATDEARDAIRAQLKELHEQWKEQQQKLAQESKDRAETMKTELQPELSRVLDQAKGNGRR